MHSVQYSCQVLRLIRAESDRYLESISKQQVWNGSEPSLQLLVLPLHTTSGSQPFINVAHAVHANSPAEPSISARGTAGLRGNGSATCPLTPSCEAEQAVHANSLAEPSISVRGTVGLRGNGNAICPLSPSCEGVQHEQSVYANSLAEPSISARGTVGLRGNGNATCPLTPSCDDEQAVHANSLAEPSISVRGTVGLRGNGDAICPLSPSCEGVQHEQSVHANSLAEPSISARGTAGLRGNTSATCPLSPSYERVRNEHPGELFQHPELFAPLPEYSSEPTLLNPSHCRLCLEPVPSGEMEEHLKACAKCSVEEYRRIVLRKALGEWPQRIPAQVLRSRLAAFKEELSDANFRQLPCASCCRLKRKSKLFDVSFPPPAADRPPSWLPWNHDQWLEYRRVWYDAVNHIFDIDRYLHSFFLCQERLTAAERETKAFDDNNTVAPRMKTRSAAEAWLRRVQAWNTNLRRDLESDSVPAPNGSGTRWLLFASSHIVVNESSGEIRCKLCKICRNALSETSGAELKPKVRMPEVARANGLWHGPDPEELKVLTFCERKVINLARVYVSVKRIFLDRSSYARTSRSEAPYSHQRNVVAYSQNPDGILRYLGINPSNLARMLQVQFVGEDRNGVRHHPDLQVSVDRLRSAFRWLSCNSWPFMEATKHHELWETDALSTDLECLLHEYASSIGSTCAGIPAEIFQGAARISAEHATIHASGPADCTPDDDADDGTEGKAAEPTLAAQDSVGIIDGGVDDISPVQIWNEIMRKYKVAQVCDQELERIRKLDKPDEKARIEQQRAMAVAAAVEALSKLHSKEVRSELNKFVKLAGDDDRFVIPHNAEIINNRDPLFWFCGFVRLFPRGDCWERSTQRSSKLSSWRWAKTLLTRADFPLWRQDVEFVASVYNVHLRREQVHAVEMGIQSATFSAQQKSDMEGLTAQGLVANAIASGDVNSVHEALKKKNLHKPVEVALQKMQVIQRNVRGSEAEKDNLVPRFFALRLWSGCSSLFFTLNPHDIRSPITLCLLQDDVRFEKEFSLDLSDAETESFLKEFVRENPRRLHEAVAANPLSATRCFHWTLKLVIRVLFNCDEIPGRSCDSIAANTIPGIFGHVRAYLGVVEPQMRKALHCHMLIQLVGFSHPEDLFRENMLPDIFRRLWYFVASISFRSTEAFADYMHVGSAMEALHDEPLLHMTKKQSGMIGEARARESMRAQSLARGLQEIPYRKSYFSPMSYVTSTVHTNSSVDASSWGKQCVRSVMASTRKTGNHVCRADVCHKGKHGKKGFCRFLFWHWTKSVDGKGKLIAKRSHGFSLQTRWNGTGAPPVHQNQPLRGCPALETTHPFHFKMTPAIMLGPSCNHDLGVLLRFPSAAGSADEACSAMLDAMGDHEYYCASYSSKDQPHVEGLLMTLADGVRAKERDIAVAKEAGEEVSSHEVCRKLLHSLMAATNRRMHKGFPEMLTYLLRKPMEYCSHQFVHVTVDPLFRVVLAHLFNVASPTYRPRDRTPANQNMRLYASPNLRTTDYPFRPKQLEAFPLYFFISACEARTKLDSNSMEWEAILNKSSTSTDPVWVRHSSHECLMSKEFRDQPLLDAENQPLHRYAYYIKLKTNSPWKVPVLFGRSPRAPDDSSPPKEKGMYALFMMMLFRPHRSPHDLISVIFKGASVVGSEDAIYNLVYDEFLRWRRDEVESISRSCRMAKSVKGERVSTTASSIAFVRNTSSPAQSFRPPYPSLNEYEISFGSREWWACMIDEKLRNYDVAKKKHGTDISSLPTNISNLPTFQPFCEPPMGDSLPNTGEKNATDDASQCSADVPNIDDVKDCLDTQSKIKNSASKGMPVALHCGVLPSGARLHDFYLPPTKVHARNPEALYWQGFGTSFSQMFSQDVDIAPQCAHSVVWNISTENASEAAERQKLYFKALDQYKIDVQSVEAHQQMKKTVDPYDETLKASVGELSRSYVRSTTIVLEGAFFLIASGVLNIPDTGNVNVKQARAFLWNAIWLQEHMNVKWHLEEDRPSKSRKGKVAFDDFALAIIGPGGTGKTAVLKVTEALTVFFAGEDTVQKLAPSNAAARLLGGDTIHSLCKLPFGLKTSLNSKKGRLTKSTLQAHRRKWMHSIAAYIDEISMVPADQFLQCDVRMRQAKMRPEIRFGGMAVNLCGDFLQLPPVNKDGSKPSLAKRPSKVAEVESVDEETAADVVESERAECRQGFELWRSIKRVVSLCVNVRAPDILSRLLAEMRAGKISDEMWDLYLSRRLQPGDPRLLATPFSDNSIHFIVHRHKIRVTRSMENAIEQSRKLQTPLYIVQARDEVVHAEDKGKMNAAVYSDLLKRVRPDDTKGLPSFLPLHRGMRFILSTKDCVRLGVMKGCPVILENIIFADEEVVPSVAVAGEPLHLRFMPICLLLRAEHVPWTLPATELPLKIPFEVDRRGLFLLRPSHDYLRVLLEDEYKSIRRTSFLLAPADTMTVYAAQGGTYSAIVVDMKRPPGMDAATHWLACYVMLSRSRSIDGLLILRAAARDELSSRPPKELLDEIDRLLALEAKSHKELVAYMQSLDLILPGEILRILSDEAVTHEEKEVSSVRASSMKIPTSCVNADVSHPQKRLRLRVKTTVRIAVPSLAEEEPKAKRSKPNSLAQPSTIVRGTAGVCDVPVGMPFVTCDSNGRRKAKKHKPDSLAQPSIIVRGSAGLCGVSGATPSTANVPDGEEIACAEVSCQPPFEQNNSEVLAASSVRPDDQAESSMPVDATAKSCGNDGSGLALAVAGLGLLGLPLLASMSESKSPPQIGEASASSNEQAVAEDDNELFSLSPDVSAPTQGANSCAFSVSTCSLECHICGPPDVLRGCQSCGRLCHDTCRSRLCHFEPCPECLSLSIFTHENSELCTEAQRYNLGCHDCHRHGCFASAIDCHAKCRSHAHVCTPHKDFTPCSSCDKFCHSDTSDPRCDFFGRSRGMLPWSVDAQQFLDTQEGTQGQLPHFSQVTWSFTNPQRTELVVDGLPYRKGDGNPGDASRGEENNCLIDSLRQTLSLQCDRGSVRLDLQSEFGAPDGLEWRRHVSHNSYLDIEFHWRAILRSLFRHNSSGLASNCDLEEYCVLALFGNVPGNGTVLGNPNARYRLVIVNWGDVHFDPCLPF